jgi:hypothetical protein
MKTKIIACKLTSIELQKYKTEVITQLKEGAFQFVASMRRV